MKKLTVIMLITAIIFTLSACGAEVTSSKSSAEADQSTAAISTTSATSSTEQSKDSTASTDGSSEGWSKIDKTVKVGDVEYTVSSIKFTKGGDLFEAEDGNTYLLIDMNVKNNTDEEQPLSSIMMFELKDGSGKTYDISLIGSANLDGEKIEMIDGSVAAKAERRGGIVYEIPENTTGLTLTINDVLGSGSETIKLN